MDRDIKLSNIKGLLIFLVVLGHLIAPFFKYYKILYLFIYSFHMPLFIMISGYFAKRVTIKKVVNLLLLLIIYHPLYRGYLILLNPEKTFKLRPKVPYYHLWYLLALIFYYLLAIGIKKLRLKNWHKIVLVLSFFAVGFTARLFAGPFEAFMKNYDRRFISDTFAYLRTLTFLPFFFLGFFLSEEGMHKVCHSLKGKKLIPLLSVIGVLLYLKFHNTMNEADILKGNHGIEELDISLIPGLIHILFAYAIAALMCYILLNVVSDRKCCLTKIGDRTLPVYLLHAFFVVPLKRLDFFAQLKPWLLLPVLVFLTAAIVFILSTDFFAKYFYYVYNPMKLIELIVSRSKLKKVSTE